MISKEKGSLYKQLKDILIERITKGVYPKGSFLPTEIQLEEEFKLSKITIRKAVELLAQEGWVEKKAGIGTTILENRLAPKLKKGQKFTEILMERGNKLEKKVKSIEIVSLDKNSEEFKLLGNNCFKLVREIYLNGKPFIYTYHYFPLSLNLSLDKSDYENSLYNTLDELGIFLSSFEDHFFATMAPDEVKEFFNEDIVLGRKRFSYDDKEQLMELSVAYYNSKEQNYIMKLNS